MEEPTDDKKQNRRLAILDAAADVFADRGYATATCDEIAKRAAVSKGTLYNYFRSKQDLFTQLFLSSVAEDEATIDGVIAQPGTAREKLEAVLGYWFEQFSRYDDLGRLVLEFWSTAAAEEEDGTFTQTLQDMYGRYRQRMTQIFKQGQSSGEFDLVYGPSMAASVVLALFDGIGLHSMMGLSVKMDAKTLATIKRGMLRALGVEPEPLAENTPTGGDTKDADA
ncbi:MAG: TetR family transcriptional regulator [Planctomycetes bacterium]|jgi:AcrR family transcriptional regulator|nr:TetR family transcriptional regulator [Planctomycetota bacterium]